ncbi:malto-oligosyltrehalose trehalohydrolase [Falsiroseomonas oryzae]|uniref:malto-oligosyltrehalose trehalohydrolase n=1 Tax=Falsiroseomonas oryzae TaxID=2766473 RepID=UPI0022EA7328|nr:malto-oligosyltrehalose trehalohydrolase [Roseomonas sp. MO-31]
MKRDLIAARDRAGATRRAHSMPFGAQPLPGAGVRFRVWAPSQRSIGLKLDGSAEALPMRRDDAGWHDATVETARPGARYRFVLADGRRLADPASRCQPEGVHGPSQVVDPTAHGWTDAGWRGRPWHQAVITELHVGAFTPAGTFRAAIERLDHLATLGVTAIELMPVGAFPGRFGWGYDGVLPFAPHPAYGAPEDLKALVQAAHARGLMVLLDVVYNHLGPEGNSLQQIAPEAFSARHATPWGAAFDLDGPASAFTRGFLIHNALYWIEEFHMDGLRLDAVHAMRDDGPRHLLEDLAEAVRAAVPDRHVHLVLENPANDAAPLARDGAGRPRLYTAQWNDDVHHALHCAVTGEAEGHYARFAGETHKLGRALAAGFAREDDAAATLPPTAFIAFAQNHDQVGNRALGERLAALAPVEAVRAAAACCLLLPQVPLLFMGEEWGAAQPFPFFCDLGPGFADAVREGRRAEFAAFAAFREPAARDRIPDPLADETFAAAKLRWESLEQPEHATWLCWHRRILAVRRAEILPLLLRIRAGGDFVLRGDGAVSVWWDATEVTLQLDTNLSGQPVDGFGTPRGRAIWQEGAAAGDTLGPWSLRWSIAGARR